MDACVSPDALRDILSSCRMVNSFAITGRELDVGRFEPACLHPHRKTMRRLRLETSGNRSTPTLPLSAFSEYNSLQVLHLSATNFFKALQEGFSADDLPPALHALTLAADPRNDEKALRQIEIAHLDWTRTTCLLLRERSSIVCTFEYGDGGNLWPVDGWVEIRDGFPDIDGVKAIRGQILRRSVFSVKRSPEEHGRVEGGVGVRSTERMLSK